MEYMTGVVERITFVNEENGYSVIRLKVKGERDLVTAVGILGGINAGSHLKLNGFFKHDPKYGRQFEVSTFEEIMPATEAAIEKYLGSGLIKGIGPVYARKIVKTFRLDTLNIIEESPERLLEIPGIGNKRMEMIKRAWIEQKEIKNLMIFLQGLGVSTNFAIKIFKAYGNEGITIIKENPYRLADDIWGIGFITADKIASSLGFGKDSPERARAGIIYILNDKASDGHCFLYRDQLIEASVKLLEAEEELIETVISFMVGEKSIIIEIIDNREIIYLPPFYFSEVAAAKKINRLNGNRGNYQQKDLERLIDNIEEEHGIKYDEIQREAVFNAIGAGFMVLTGGPGTGKTTTTLAIIEVFKKTGAKIMLAAPTGRAAKRMAETCRMEAKTIHRLLEYKPPEGYSKNENNKLETDVLIIDESSMIDIILMHNLLKAIKDNTTVILVGDVDQLPSVGPGNVLKDIIESEKVTVVRLKRIFRQAAGSMIITNAHRINKGIFPIMKGERRDFFFMKEDDPDKIPDIIKDLCERRLPRHYKVDPVRDIQVLSPMQRGQTGTFNLNRELQETLNKSTKTVKYGGNFFKVNDKVMQIRNNYEKNVFNGDIGFITSIDDELKEVTVNYESEYVNYDFNELDELVLAYVTTIHKSQGSEYSIVVCPLTTQHYMMLQRNLLYTLVTRAKMIFVGVGSMRALKIAVDNNKTARRNTLLSKRIGDS